MTKEERIKKGYVGKRTFIDTETGEKHVIDFDDPEGGRMMTVKEYKEFMRLQIKHNQKGFSEFTEEELKMYSEFTKDEDLRCPRRR